MQCPVYFAYLEPVGLHGIQAQAASDRLSFIAGVFFFLSYLLVNISHT